LNNDVVVIMFLLLCVVIVVLHVLMYMKNHLGVEENKVTAVTLVISAIEWI